MSFSARGWAIAGVTVAELLAMSLWFSATAILPSLMQFWEVSAGKGAWLTMSVQLGFVVGAASLSALNVADRIEPRFVMAAGAAAGALANGAIPFLEPAFGTAVLLRFATGVSLAAVYPVGMKIVASWSAGDRGLLIGILVGSLTLGSASPHLVNALGGAGDWRPVMYFVSAISLIASLVALLLGRMGPNAAAAAPLDYRQLSGAFRDRPLRLANLGYLGHMWELYAMWTWIPVFLTAAFAGSPLGESNARSVAALVSFAVIGVGGVGSVMAGRLSDRWGRTRTTMLAMGVSGFCCVAVGFAFSAPTWVLIALCMVWGVTVIADSAQFSAAVSELADPRYVGTQLTAQTAAGFLLTIASIQLVPLAAGVVGWRWAFALLALGPAAGIRAMSLLGRSSAASRLAGGKG